jgi:hypothetical protein
MTLMGKRTLVVGGTSGIGFGVAQAVRVVNAPPSNSAATGRPSTRLNALGSALHLVLHRAILLNRLKSFSQNNFCLIRRPDALPCVRNPG